MWARRLAAAANVLACVRPRGAGDARVVLGCDDGALRVLNGAGKVVGMGKLDGRPVVIERFAGPGGRQLVAVGTVAGQVAVFDVGR